jgi:16S rRNA (uracil1498-N3)-methyltransferase
VQPLLGAEAKAHVFVASLADGGLELTSDDHHHLARVLRLRGGEVVTASDGAGSWRPCAWRDGARRGLDPTGPTVTEPAPVPPLTVAFAPTKGDRPEWVVQKLTELGVDRIVPLAADRSVVRWDGDRADRQIAKLTKVAREAAMQSRRVWLPSIEPVTTVTALSAGIALAHFDGAPPSLDHPAVAIGPEGGWSDDELALDVAHVALGPTVLRAETAAVAAGTLLAALRAGLVR